LETTKRGTGLGIALAGGGAQALAQVGLLRGLETAGVPIHYIAGTSAGAVVGAVYATSPDAAAAERRILRHLRTIGAGFDVSSVASLAPSGSSGRRGRLHHALCWWRLARRREALIGGAAMGDSLRALLGEATFADTRIPFGAVALDLVAGRSVVLRTGSLAQATYASSAIPGLFEPLEVGGRVLVDGAWAEPMPVAACRALGASCVVAARIRTAGAGSARGALATAVRADALTRHLLEETQLRAADAVIQIDVGATHFADFSGPEELIAAGTRAVALAHRNGTPPFAGPGAVDRVRPEGRQAA
jgi:NTE family protein